MFKKLRNDYLLLQDKWKIRIQLTKPVTWPPLVCGVVCGAAASGIMTCKHFKIETCYLVF